MTLINIETIKKEGAKKALLQAINDQMWWAKCRCEEATQKSCGNFFREVNNVIQAIESARLLHDEWVKMRNGEEE